MRDLAFRDEEPLAEAGSKKRIERVAFVSATRRRSTGIPEGAEKAKESAIFRGPGPLASRAHEPKMGSYYTHSYVDIGFQALLDQTKAETADVAFRLAPVAGKLPSPLPRRRLLRTRRR